MSRLALLLVLVMAAMSLSCRSRIPGETDAPPPAGGPKASAKHPPGESQAVIDREGK